jgi:hypothetical protein
MMRVNDNSTKCPKYPFHKGRSLLIQKVHFLIRLFECISSEILMNEAVAQEPEFQECLN